MQIRQIAVHYQAEDDRLLLRVLASDEQAFAVWLTRRLTQRLWPHLVTVVQQLGVTQALMAPEATRPSSHATLAPEARAMLAEGARRQALGGTDFSRPYDAGNAAQPLGSEPLLATTMQLTPEAQGHLHLTVRDAKGRQIGLTLTATLAIAVHELMRAALAKAEWGFGAEGSSVELAAVQPAPRTLN